MLAALPAGSTIANDGLCLTVLCVPDGIVTRVFAARIDTEVKFRRKVGEFNALSRWNLNAKGGMLMPGHADARGTVASLSGATATETFFK